MERLANPSAAPKAPLHPQDKKIGHERVKNKVGSLWKFSGANEPSERLINDAFALLQRNMVRHMAWERCTSRSQEVADKDFAKDAGLELTEYGVFKHASAPGPDADVSGDMRWENAMRRRGAAMDIAGLMDLEKHNLWIEYLRKRIEKDPPNSHLRTSWEQVLEADTALFEYVSEQCAADGPRK